MRILITALSFGIVSCGSPDPTFYLACEGATESTVAGITDSRPDYLVLKIDETEKSIFQLDENGEFQNACGKGCKLNITPASIQLSSDSSSSSKTGAVDSTTGQVTIERMSGRLSSLSVSIFGDEPGASITEERDMTCKRSEAEPTARI